MAESNCNTPSAAPRYVSKSDGVVLRADSSAMVCRAYTRKGAENIASILNAHDELRAALECAERLMAGMSDIKWRKQFQPTLDTVRAALAKVDA